MTRIIIVLVSVVSFLSCARSNKAEVHLPDNSNKKFWEPFPATVRELFRYIDTLPSDKVDRVMRLQSRVDQAPRDDICKAAPVVRSQCAASVDKYRKQEEQRLDRLVKKGKIRAALREKLLAVLDMFLYKTAESVRDDKKCHKMSYTSPPIFCLAGWQMYSSGKDFNCDMYAHCYFDQSFYLTMKLMEAGAK